MGRQPGYAICAAVSIFLCFTPAALAEEAKEEGEAKELRWVWYPTAKCKTKPEKGTPGSSPETAITLKHFPNLKSFALKEANIGAGVVVGEDEFKPNCKWVRLTGFFRWFNYYHYRGQLFESAKEYYFSPGVNYIIEDFSKDATRRGDLHARRVTLIGRFYNLCAAAERDEKESGERWWIIGGPCHYGRDKGMMLTDVIIEKVYDDAPRFLAGDQNRDIIQELVPYEAKDKNALVKRVREWAALVKKGPKAYFAHRAATHPLYDRAPQLDDDFVEDMRKRITHPDSYISYLSNLPAIQKLDMGSVPVAVFRNQYYVEDMRDTESIGCICLIDDCTDRWPLLHSDAENFVGAAACTTLSRSEEDPVWRW
ncbi:MAG: hypothetical protein ACLFV8_14385 [Alphaproteobacteria bacterium]